MGGNGWLGWGNCDCYWGSDIWVDRWVYFREFDLVEWLG